MVKNPRDVPDVPRSFRGAEREVVVLRAVEVRSHPAEFLEQLPPHHDKMAHVHVRQQQLRRPIRLELRAEADSIDIDFVVVGVQKIGFRMLRDIQGHLGQSVRSQLVVVVEEGEKIALGHGRRGIRRSGNAEIHRVAGQFDARVDFGVAGEAFQDASIRAGIVDDAEFPIAVNLLADAVDGPFQDRDRRNVNGHDDRNARQMSRRLGKLRTKPLGIDGPPGVQFYPYLIRVLGTQKSGFSFRVQSEDALSKDTAAFRVEFRESPLKQKLYSPHRVVPKAASRIERGLQEMPRRWAPGVG